MAAIRTGEAEHGERGEFEEALEGAKASAEKVPDIFVYRKTAAIAYFAAIANDLRAKRDRLAGADPVRVPDAIDNPSDVVERERPSEAYAETDSAKPMFTRSPTLKGRM